ncbi:MAG: hypothetical protein NC350_05725 [Corallococcus sp.]|nr:hypothetical protein [Corallococcus sp.]
MNDERLLSCIKKGRDIPLEILGKCKSLQTTETFKGWNELETDGDIEHLMNISLNFHDGYIENIERADNDIYVKFNCWSCSITIKFINLKEFNKGEVISWESNCILETKMYFDGANIRWFVSDFNIEEYDNHACYFVAERAEYKVELRNSF